MNDRQDISHDILIEEYMEDNDLVIGDIYEILDGCCTSDKSNYPTGVVTRTRGSLYAVDIKNDVAHFDMLPNPLYDGEWKITANIKHIRKV